MLSWSASTLWKVAVSQYNQLTKQKVEEKDAVNEQKQCEDGNDENFNSQDKPEECNEKEEKRELLTNQNVEKDTHGSAQTSTCNPEAAKTHV